MGYNDSSGSANTAWKDAQNACYKYLISETGSIEGVNCFIGDRLPDAKENVWCFICSGGREQIQNYQVPSPAFSWYSNAILRGQYKNLEDAMDLASTIQNTMPAYKDVEQPGQIPGGHVKNRGIPPNVQLFEITYHPEVFSDIVELKDDKRVQYWIVIVNFRVVYNKNKQ